MKTNRRSFLGLLGIGTVSAPLAAKAALDADIAQQAGVSITGMRARGLMDASAPGSIGIEDDITSNLNRAADYIKMFGVPDFYDKGLRENAKWINGMDPDIACKRSWSMSVKIMTQRQRNYERGLENLTFSAWSRRKRSMLKAVTGFDWPW